MKLRHALTIIAFAIVLTGCAATGNVQPQGFKQQLAYAEGVHSAVIEAVDSSLNAHMLSSDAAASLASKADEAQLTLNAARTAYEAGDTAGANAKLAIALTALQTLQDYLRATGAPK